MVPGFVERTSRSRPVSRLRRGAAAAVAECAGHGMAGQLRFAAKTGSAAHGRVESNKDKENKCENRGPEPSFILEIGTAGEWSPGGRRTVRCV
jgi:hypothetical protein